MDRPDDWPFADPPNLATITTRQVIEEGHPILLVTTMMTTEGGKSFVAPRST